MPTKPDWKAVMDNLKRQLQGYDEGQVCSLQIVDEVEHAGAVLREILDSSPLREPCDNCTTSTPCPKHMPPVTRAWCAFCGGTGWTYSPRRRVCSTCSGTGVSA